MADPSGRKGRMMLITGTPLAAGVLGFFETRYPTQVGKYLKPAARIGAAVTGYFAVKGGRHAMKYAIASLILSVPEAKDYGQALGRQP